MIYLVYQKTDLYIYSLLPIYSLLLALRWGILGCGLISGDFAQSLSSCKYRNEVSIYVLINKLFL